MAHEYKIGLFQEPPCPSWMKMYQALGKNAGDVAVTRGCASLSGYLFKRQASDHVGRACDSKTRGRAREYAF